MVSVDPLYRLDAAAIRERIAATYEQMMEQARMNRERFVWDAIPSVEELGRVRTEAMEEFLGDFELGKGQGRYVDGELPVLAHSDQSFDLALCSHFLFLYTEQLSEEFHRAAVRELCRVAREVRIFPLLALDGSRSRHVAGVEEELRNVCEVSVEAVEYEFQRGGNQMMRLRTRT